MHLKNVPDLVATCLVLHNMCIVFGDNLRKKEWFGEATNDVHNGLAIPNVPGSSMRERLAVANLALHSLARIDENSRETLEDIKQEDAWEFEVAMGTSGKSFKELSARRNGIARSIWMTKTKSCIAEIFIDEKNWSEQLSKVFSPTSPLFFA